MSSTASTTLKRIALFKVNKVPYLLEFNINWAAATHLTRVWSRWDELGKQAVGQTTVRKGSGNSTVSKSIFCGGVFSTCKIILGIHTYIFHNREWFYFLFLGGGQPSDGGGHVPSVPPGIYAHVWWWARAEQLIHWMACSLPVRAVLVLESRIGCNGFRISSRLHWTENCFFQTRPIWEPMSWWYCVGYAWFSEQWLPTMTDIARLNQAFGQLILC